MSTAVKENKMGVMPVKKLIVNMSLPMMASMLVQALYNVVDSIFVARLSEDALTAVTLAFPLQNLMIAVATGTGVGFNVLLSRALGAKQQDKVNGSANAGIFLTIFSYLIFVVLGLVAAVPFIHTQTTDPAIARDSITYLRIVMLLSFGIFFEVTFERLLQATGRTSLSMIVQLSGAIFNIVFDPILIFGLLGFPKMGVAGAAVATVLGQIVAACVGIIMNIRRNPEIHVSLGGVFSTKMKIVKEIYIIAIPSILMVSIGSVMTYLMNLILIRFSTTATAVFGVYFKLQSFFFMPIFGMNNGLIPVLSYNYGARRRKRIDEALRFALALAFCIMVVGMLVFELMPNLLLDLFSASDAMRSMGVSALRRIAVHFPLAAIGIALGSVFQAFGKSFYALIISIMRQLVVLIPAAYLLSLSGDVNNVWWCFLIAEIVSLIFSIIFFRRVYRQKVEPLGREE